MGVEGRVQGEDEAKVDPSLTIGVKHILLLMHSRMQAKCLRVRALLKYFPLFAPTGASFLPFTLFVSQAWCHGGKGSGNS